jgi:hypothetical protein
VVVSVASLAMLLSWSDATGRVPTKDLPVITMMTPVSVLLVQHCLELFDMHIDLFIILGEMGGHLVDQHP